MIHRSRSCAVLVGSALLAVACGEPDPVPPSQVILHVETDAPVPRSDLGADDLVLFDRLRISVHRSADEPACVGCTREFALSSEIDREQLSAGITPTSGAAVAHVELFAERNRDRFGNPDLGSSLSAWVRLPRTGEREVRSVHVTLSMASFGQPVGSQTEPVDGASEGPRAPLARWPDARTTPCTASARADEACVPGGVVWMGNALRTPGPAGGLAARLVRMSPFLLDLREVTVADLRASGLAVTNRSFADPVVFPGDPTCTYTAAADAHESLPVTCISHDLAAAYCAARGKKLPTEAQYEYVQGGLRGQRYPWGNDDPACADAVFGRDKGGLGPCSEGPESAYVPGSGARDVLTIGGRSVVDLAGNVAEWAREGYRDANAACNGGGYLQDPMCEGPATDTFVTRGGSFIAVPLGLRSEVRIPARLQSSVIGFRCARAAQ